MSFPESCKEQFSVSSSAISLRKRPNQSMKPTTPERMIASNLATVAEAEGHARFTPFHVSFHSAARCRERSEQTAGKLCSFVLVVVSALTRFCD